MGCLCLFGMALAQLKIIVIGKLLTRPNGADRLDENVVFFVYGLTVGRTGVIDPTGRIPIPCGVDDDLIIDGKEHGVRGIFLFLTEKLIRLLVGDARAGVLDDDGTLRDGSERKHTLAVNAGSSNQKAPAFFSLQTRHKVLRF